MIVVDFFFGLRWKRVKSVFANCVGFIWVFLLQWTPKQDWFFYLYIYIYIFFLNYYGKIGVC